MNVGAVIQFNGLYPPASVVNEHRAVALEDEQPDRLGQHGRKAAGVRDLATGDDETHSRNLPPEPDMASADKSAAS